MNTKPTSRFKIPNYASVVAHLSFCLVLLGSGLPGRVSAQQADPAGRTAHGIQLYQQGDLDAAVKTLKEVVKRSPADADAWYYLGLAYYAQARIRESCPCFEKSIQLRPDLPDAYAKLAFALIIANEPHLPWQWPSVRLSWEIRAPSHTMQSRKQT